MNSPPENRLSSLKALRAIEKMCSPKLLSFFLMIGCFFLFGCPNSVTASFKERDKILYKDLGTLYFSPGERTRARRTYSVPQLQCLKGCQYPQPSLVECTNTGWDGSSNLWKCKSNLDSSYALDNVEIVCEGYSSADDPYVTVGSCSLEYSIKKKSTSSDTSSFVMGAFICVFVLVACYILFNMVTRSNEEPMQRNQNSFTNDDYPDDGQGPQMGWNIPGMNQRRAPGTQQGFGSGSAPRPNTCNDQGARNAGRGDFWSGLATGGVLGYLMGSNRNSGSYSGTSYRSSGFNPRRSSGSSGLFASDSGSTSESVTTARYRQR